MDKKAIEAVYKLSPLQQGILFECLLAPNEPLYIEQTSWPVYLDLRPSLFERAWLEITRRHAILRTAFLHEGLESPVQAVLREVTWQLSVVDMSQLDESVQHQAVMSFIDRQPYQPYRFNRPPLSRVTLLKFSPVDFVLVWNFHHILMDGWSSSLVLTEVLRQYGEYRLGIPFTPPPPRPYRDYIAWLERQPLEPAAAFWRETLAGNTQPTRLACDRGPGREGENRVIQRAMSDFDLASLARKLRVTPNSLVQAVWALVFARMSGERDLIWGNVFSGRPPSLSGVENMVGLFINSQPVRVRLEPTERLRDLAARIQSLILNIQRFEHSPLAQIREWVGGKGPLFEALVVYENYPVDLITPPPPENGRTLGFQSGTYKGRTHYPLNLMVMPGVNAYLRLSWDSARFDEDDMAAMGNRLINAFGELMRDPDQPVQGLHLLAPSEIRALLAQLTATAADLPGPGIHALLEPWLERSPEAPALVMGETRLSYRQLHQRASAIARALSESGVNTGALVGICCPRSPELIAAVLGILMVGAAYLPLDPAYPAQRLTLMLDDARPRAVLSSAAHAGLFAETRVLALEAIDLDHGAALGPAPLPAEVAYVIYTSGSTGKPKGVLIPHAAIRNFVWASVARFGFDTETRCLQAATVNFDAFDYEVFCTLAAGGQLCLANAEQANSGPALADLLLRCQVSHLFTTPSNLSLLPEGDYPHLRCLCVGGEAYSQALIDRFAPARMFFNVYGPTENTVYSLSRRSFAGEARVLLGQPLANTRAYVFDRDGVPVLPGVTGELLLGGLGLARGYLNRPALTAERFVPNPFDTVPGQRLYRTGDLVRAVADGGSGYTLEFMGRTDFQVKLRGQRIELPEIEAHLARHPALARCAVVHSDFGGGDQRLTAFVERRAGAELDPAELRGFLRQSLPEYQIPSQFAVLEPLPVLATGKIDRNQLARLAASGNLAETRTGAEPRTDLERQVAALWAELLKRESVPRDVDFFDLGGHSLLATRVMFRIQQHFKVALPLERLFLAPTVVGLAQALAERLAPEAPKVEAIPVTPREQRTAFPLSHAQLRLWFLDRMNSSRAARTAYNMPLALHLDGPLHLPALEQALAALVARHESLRTRFAILDGEPVQRIAPAAGFALPLIDLAAQADAARALAAREADWLFDLERGPLFRAQLLRLAPAAHVLLCNQHHIISDGWSLELLARELHQLYQAFARGQALELAPLPLAYADFALWQRQALDGEALRAQSDYWRQQLRDLPKLIELPLDHPRPALQTYAGATVPVHLPAPVYQQLVALAERRGTTLFMLGEALFSILLWRHCGQTDLAIGTPSANRARAELAGIIGFFVNTLVLRHRLDPRARFVDYLDQVRATATAAYAHGDFPFEKLVELLQPERDLRHAALFQVMINWQNAEQTPPGLTGLKSRALAGASLATKFDLSLHLTDSGTELRGYLLYNRDLFAPETAARWAKQLACLAAAVAAEPERELRGLELLDPAERQALIAFANPALLPHTNGGAAAWILNSAARRPSAPALEFVQGAHVKLTTYGDLAEGSARLASRLLQVGARRAAPVAVNLSDPRQVLIALLAVARIGAMSVPVDPSHPLERRRALLADAGAALGLGEPDPADQNTLWLAVDLTDAPIQPLPDAEILSDQPLYLIYTSGSTGMPKGVVLPHHAFLAMLQALTKTYTYNEQSRVLITLSYAFDMGFLMRWCTLSAGGVLIALPAQEVADPVAVAYVCRSRSVNAMHATPSWLREMAAASVDFRGLRVLRAGGEAMPTELVVALRQLTAPTCRFFNGYGPTEAGVSSAFHELEPSDERSDRLTVPIGQALANHSLFVVDRHGQLCLPGVPGELLIGRHLAHGYLGKPALTALRFVPDPFSGDVGARLYRSGDLVRWLFDRARPCLFFMGRTDRQLKLRGYRIEPGEIEALLAAHPAVQAAAVALRGQEPSRRLIAYLVLTPDTQDTPDFAAFLEPKLPPYMRPSAYVRLQALPLNANGKTDYAALPEPERVVPTSSLAPASALAAQLAAIWAELFGLDQVEPQAHFFQLGGHSLLVTRLVARAAAVGIELPLVLVFEYPVLADLARALEGRERDAGIQPASTGDGDPLSYAQLRLFFLDRFNAGSAAATSYNMPIALYLSGPLHVPAFEAAIDDLVARHSSLRTRFLADGDEPRQVVDPYRPLRLAVIALGDRPELARQQAATAAAHRFDLERGPLFRCQLLRLGDDHHLVLFNQHHIISDGWSLEILTRELCACYAERLAGRAPRLAPLAITYGDYAIWQRQHLAGPRWQRLWSFWRETLADLPGALDLPLDHPRPAIQTTRGAAVELSIPPAAYAPLATLASQIGASPFMVCDALFACLLARWSGQRDVAIGTLSANRERAELAPLLGFFVNTLVLRHRVPSQSSFSDWLAQVRDLALAAFAHGEMPFEKLVESLNPDRSMAHAPLFQVSLNWRTAEAGDLRLQGLRSWPLEAQSPAAKFDLSLNLTDRGDRIEGAFTYNVDLFEHATIVRLAHYLESLAAAAAAAPQTPLERLDYLGAYATWTHALWRPEPTPPPPMTLGQLFARTVAARPDQPALVCVQGERASTHSYAELDRETDRLAARLAEQGVRALTPLAICLENPYHQALALIAAVKAGALLVPIDPVYPPERQAYILADANVAHFLTESGVHTHLPEFNGHWLDFERVLAQAPSARPAVSILPEQPLYIIYTSGSTGRPKGVVVAHQSFARMTQAYLNKLEFDAATIALPTMSYAFDFGFIERWAVWTAAGTLVTLPTRDLVDPTCLSEALVAHAVNTLQCTPAFIREMAAAGVPLGSMRMIHVGGEQVKSELIRTLRHATSPDCLFVNGYGPTETTVSAAMHLIGPGDEHSAWEAIPVGTEIGNHCLFVCDPLGRPVASGAAGELRVGRDLAFGYHRQPRQTAERFVPDDLSGDPGARLYRTGDLLRARLDREGRPVLEFRGRIDRQVKLRGYRIELGEIEAAFTALAEVQAAAVFLRTVGDQVRLTACVLPTPGAALEVTNLQRHLSTCLPEYMLPSQIVFVDSFPLTANGKLDFQALAQLADRQDLVARRAKRPPTTPEERLLAEIWCSVLDLEQVSADAHFFQLGGHSLLCTRVLGRLDRAGYAVPLRLLFEHPVLAELAHALAEQRSRGQAIEVAPRQPGARYPLSHAQSRLFFLDAMATTDDAATAYNLPIALFLDGPLHLLALESAVARLIARHESLRTRFAKHGDGAFQLVDPPAPFRLTLLDLGLQPASLNELAAREAHHRFDLARGPLFRCTLVRVHAQRHLLLCNQHHIITDGWSIGILTRELQQLYDAAALGLATPALAPLPLGYVDYALWQRQTLEGERLQARIDTWRERLAGLPSLIELPIDRARPSVQTFRGEAVPLAFGPALRARLLELAARAGASLFMVCDALFSILLARASNQDDVAVGTLSANRERAELTPLIGFFVNTLVLRHHYAAATSFLAYLDQVRLTALAAFADGDVPFEKLVEILKPERSLDHTPIFQVAFNWQTSAEAPIRLQGLVARPFAAAAPSAKFDLTLSLADDGHDLRGALVFNPDLFDRETIARLARFLTTLAASAAEAPFTAIGALDFLDQADRRWLCSFWNPPAEPPCRATLPAYFLDAAARYPQAQALVALAGASATTYSYAQLERDSRVLAAHLVQLGVRVQTPVGICLRDPYLVLVGLIASARSGATLVLIDPIYPLERQEFILADTGAALFLSERAIHERRDFYPGTWLDLDTLGALAEPATWREPAILPEQALYIIYTSGSTGRPKGVVLPHQAFCRMMDDYAEKLGLSPATVAIQTMSYAFDFGFIERWSTLAAGAVLIALPAHELTDPARFGAAMRDYRVDALQGTPSFVREMIAAGVSFAALKLLHLGGEAVKIDFVRQVRRQAGDQLIFINGYGPTEAAVSSAMHFIDAIDERSVWDTAPIGRDVANHVLFVRDHSGQLVPPGALGELVVGRLLAFGYLKRPSLTASLFVPDDLTGEYGSRLYRTGDLVRARFDHGERPVLEFRGRIDRQLKLRGYRIEPSEIEAVLGSLGGVRQNAVFPWSFEGHRLLTACVLPRPGLQLDPEALQRALRERLPDYMVPAVIAFVDQFPLTPNGKLDLTALGQLAAQQWHAESRQDSYIAPRTPEEWLLAEVWAEVLNLDRVSVQANFFQLGGHSLLCTRVIALLHQRGVHLPLRQIFEFPVLEQLAQKLAAAQGHAALTPASPGPQGAYPLSFAQQRLCFIDQLVATTQTAGAYSLPLALALDGPLELLALEAALAGLIARHPSLRTRFVPIDDERMQRIEPVQPYRLTLVDLGPDQDQARRLAARHAEWTFDLARGPLFRVLVLRVRADRHLLLLNQHHIITDGWSVGVLTRELCACYQALALGLPLPTLPELTVTYADYAQWQRGELQGERLAAYADYWTAQLADLPGQLELPTDRPRPTLPRYRGEALPIALPPALVAEARRLAEQTGATLFMVFDAVFSILLARHSGQDDLAIGTPWANRDRPELAPLIGFFVNTLVLRHRPDPRLSFAAYLEQVRRTALAAFAHGAFPFEKLVELLQPERHLGLTPLFQVMFNWQAESEASVNLPGLAAHPLGASSVQAKFDLVLSLAERGDRVVGSLVYDRDLFEHATMARFAAQFVALAHALVSAPQLALARVDLLTEDDRRWLLQNGNPPSDPPTANLAPDWFRLQAARTPSATALVALEHGRACRTSYAELDAASDALAAHLAALGVRPATPVGVHLRDPRTVLIGLLGAAKLGALLVFIDPVHPEARQRFILEDSATRLVLTQAGLARPSVQATWLDLDASLPAARPPAVRILPEQPVYLIYTSGSTGRPKGVLLPQSAFATAMRSHLEHYPYRDNSVILLTLSYAFDFGLIVRMCTLASGGTLVALSQAELADPIALARTCRDYAVDTLHCTPSFARELFSADIDLRGLKVVHMGGEAVRGELVAELRARLAPGCLILNGYGPTEAGVSATLFQLDDHVYVDREAVPIGSLIADHGLFVCDRHGRLTPPGVPGELWIGRQLASAYLNRPDLTARQFVPDPYSGDTGARLYRSGDLVRWRLTGPGAPCLVFLGRIDRQLKLRGYRIEPGEIEALLARHPAVRAVAVCARADERGEPLLVAYLCLESAASEHLDFAAYLDGQLPAYMIPAAFVVIERLPLNASGKLDESALPRPMHAQHGETLYLAPRTTEEWLLAEVWAEVLNLDRVSVQANFFQLGGHSLLCTRVIARLHQRGVHLPLRLLFEYPVLEQLAQQLAAIQSHGFFAQATPGPQGAYPLSFAQQRLCFIDELVASPQTAAAYNMPLALVLDGPLQLLALEAALAGLIARHPSLRTRFVRIDGERMQRIEPVQPYRLTLVDLGPEEGQARQLAARHADWAFDLARGPLFRVLVLRVRADRHLLLLNQHHIISDGWSVGVLTRELCDHYRALALGLEVAPLPPLPVTYADYAQWQRGELQGERLAAYADYWSAQLADLPGQLELPTDRPRPTLPRYRGEALPIALPPALVAEARRLAEQTGATLFMVFDAVFSILLARHSGQDDLAIGTPWANRDRPELAPLIGFFVNTLVLRHRPDPRLSFAAYLEQVRRTALAAFAHGAFPFEKLVELLQPERHLGLTPLFQVMFNWQAESEASVNLPGLSAQSLGVGAVQAKFDLVLSLAERGDRVVGSLVYDRDLFDHATMARFAAQFVALAKALVTAPQLALARVDLLTEEDRRWLLQNGNPPSDPPTANLAPDWFRLQAARTPSATALVALEHGRLSRSSYAELDADSDALAAHLATLGVGAATPVGVHLRDPRAVLVGLLAAAKLGALLVLIDPVYPEARQRFILEDSATRLVLTQAGLAHPDVAATWLDLDAHYPPASPPAVRILPEQPVYLIYTSGSTGRPKGVLLPQSAFATAVRSHLERYPYHDHSNVLLTLSYAFDFGMIVRMCTLASGGTLVALSQAELADPDALARACRDLAVDTLHCTPSFARELIGADLDLRGLKVIHLGGEALRGELVAELRARLAPGCLILNGYGPTEAGVSATLYTLADDQVFGGHEAVPIGSVIADHGLFVCDRQGRLTPPGVPGELWIGRQLASAYLNRPDLTASRFVPDPYSGDPGARLYRSGDLVRWRLTGAGAPCLTFLGRIDRQLKLRGYRIEPGEIEALLARHPAVRAVAVSARPDERGEPLLAAYLCLESGASEPLDFAAYLDGQLPAYMIPAAFVVIERLPLNANGKLDEAALPRPLRVQRDYRAPSGEIETAMAALWAELLGLARVGADDHFFELGGHSLQATRLIHQIQRRFDVTLPLQILFLSPTVAALSAAVAARHSSELARAEGGELVVTLRQPGEGVPLFLVHPIGGHVFCYRELAQCLGPDQGCYAFRAVGIDGEAEPLDSIEAMAATYLEQLERLCPTGPVVLGGWSLGGAVAYEMATRLHAAGRAAVQVVLIDTYLPGPSAAAFSEQQELVAFARDLELPVPAEVPPRLEDLSEALRARPEFAGLDLPGLRRLFRVYRSHRAALTRWLAQASALDVLLLHSASYPEAGLDLWRQRVALRHAVVDGDHYSMLKTPHVAKLAHRVRAHLPIIQFEDRP